MSDAHTILDEPIGMGRIIVTARPGLGPLRGQWLVTFVRFNGKKRLLDAEAVWLPKVPGPLSPIGNKRLGAWWACYWLPFRSRLVPSDALQRAQDWLRDRPVPTEVAS
jgi:hypothetical protein